MRNCLWGNFIEIGTIDCVERKKEQFAIDGGYGARKKGSTIVTRCYIKCTDTQKKCYEAEDKVKNSQQLRPKGFLLLGITANSKTS